MFTGEIKEFHADYMKFRKHEAVVFYTEKLPPVNYKDIEYFMPIIEGRINGYYKVERVGIREKDEKQQLRLKLTDFTPLGEEWVSVVDKMEAGALISKNYVNALYKQTI